MGQRFTPTANPFAKNVQTKQRFTPQSQPNIVFTGIKGIENIPGKIAVQQAEEQTRLNTKQQFEKNISKDFLENLNAAEKSLGKPIQDFTLQEIYNVSGGDVNKIKLIQDTILSSLNIKSKEQNVSKTQDEVSKKKTSASIGPVVDKESGTLSNADFFSLTKEFKGDVSLANEFMKGIQGDPNYKSFSGEAAKNTALSAQGKILSNELRKKIEGGASLFLPQVFDRDVDAIITDLTDTIGRLRSGAAIKDDEEKRMRSLVPSILDSSATKFNKLKRLERQFDIIGGTISTTQRFNSIVNNFLGENSVSPNGKNKSGNKVNKGIDYKNMSNDELLKIINGE